MAMMFKVEKMNCGGCARKVTEVIRAATPDADVKIDIEAKTVEIAQAKVEPSMLAKVITDAGYPATAVS